MCISDVFLIQPRRISPKFGRRNSSILQSYSKGLYQALDEFVRNFLYDDFLGSSSIVIAGSFYV